MDKINKIAVIGNYLPRKCGIATFTADLVNAFSEVNPKVEYLVVAMNDLPEGYRYPERVNFEISQNRFVEYQLAADFLNISRIDAVSLQHEYGIFGGDAGHYILALLRKLRVPIVTTLHTVLEHPTDLQKKVLNEICELSTRIVVMSEKSIEFLKRIHSVPKEKISLIYHGIPNIPFVDPSYYKDEFVAEGKKIILTFGLLSPNKGIEYIIEALPNIVKKHPEVIFLLVGATHPTVKRERGDEYRRMLEFRAKNLHVERHVKYINQFVDSKKLRELLGAADVYVTPYLSEAQIVSGTLSYAMGAGKAIVSTPYWYAAEMLADDRGILVDFKNANQMADAINSLLDDPVKCNAMRKSAYKFSRQAIWSQVGGEYMNLFGEIQSERANKPKILLENESPETDFQLPEINLNHFKLLTDDTGMLQHATYTIPNLDHGYCVDDNARALIVAVLAQYLMPDNKELVVLQKKFLAFIMHAYNEDTGTYRNFLSFSRQWLEDSGSEDSQGRTIWGLGVCSALSKSESCVSLSTTLFHRNFPLLEKMVNPRAISYALIGIHAYLARFAGNRAVRRIRNKLALTLYGQFNAGHTVDWSWFEETVTYGNFKIPQALLLSGYWMKKSDMMNVAYKSLDWLIDIQTENSRFSPVGCNGWYVKGNEKARFDQQPIEAHGMLETCLLAYQLSGDKKYQKAALRAFHWYLGQNDLNEPLYDFSSGGCRDGLTPNGANANQGAESTLSWLLSLLYMQEASVSDTEISKMQYIHRINH